MTDPKASILATERAKGYSEGVGQATMVCHDEAYYAGQCAARAEAPSRLVWWSFGVACGTVIQVAFTTWMILK